MRTALDIGTPPDFRGRCCIDCGKPFGLGRDLDAPLANGGATEYNNLGDRCYTCHKAKTRRDRQAGLLGPNPPTGRSKAKKPPPPDSS